jgi:hypothetical protein
MTMRSDATPRGQSRPLTPGEIALGRSVYGGAIDYARVEMRRRKWFPLQPRLVAMAPSGHIHFHPDSPHWSEDYAREALELRALFVHELCHVWQRQRGIWLPVARHPFCRYHYRLTPGWPLARYGIEQQAEIIKHAWMLRQGATVPGAPPLEQYESLLPFRAG